MKIWLVCLFLIDQVSKSMQETEDKRIECSSLLENFALATADFMLCSVSNARPIHMCSSCVGAFNDVINSHNNLLEMEDTTNTTCKEQLINLDRLEIIEAGFNYVNDLWLKGQCQSCFIDTPNVTLPYELSNNTKHFQRLYSDTEMCFTKYYNSSTHVYDKAVCQNCTELYFKMNNFYNALKKDLGDGHLCMDVVDTMNITQNLWSNTLHCGETRRQPDYPILATCAVFLIIPLVFYTSARAFTKSTPSVIVRQKRLSQRFTDKLRSRAGSMISQFRF